MSLHWLWVLLYKNFSVKDKHMEWSLCCTQSKSREKKPKAMLKERVTRRWTEVTVMAGLSITSNNAFIEADLQRDWFQGSNCWVGVTCPVAWLIQLWGILGISHGARSEWNREGKSILLTPMATISLFILQFNCLGKTLRSKHACCQNCLTLSYAWPQCSGILCRPDVLLNLFVARSQIQSRNAGDGHRHLAVNFDGLGLPNRSTLPMCHGISSALVEVPP